MARVLFQRPKDDDGDPEQRIAFAIAGDPTDEDAPPCDGLEYLRRVRKEAQQLPTVVAATRPDSEHAGPSRGSARALPLEPLARPPRALKPDAAWEQRVLADFAAVQLRAPAATRAGDTLPHAADASAWESFCFGRGASDASGRGQPPLLSTVAALDQCQALALLQAFERRVPVAVTDAL